MPQFLCENQFKVFSVPNLQGVKLFWENNVFKQKGIKQDERIYEKKKAERLRLVVPNGFKLSFLKQLEFIVFPPEV